MVEAAARRGRLPELAKYEALEEIGHGGMATVYRARDRRLGRDVALKVIHPHLRNSAEVRSRFFAEAKAVAKLRHPNIVEVYDVSEASEPDQYLVVELVRGATLRQLRQRCGAMPPEVAAAIALELLSALAHANGSGVVHRDVKPENVLIEHRPMAPDAATDSAETATGAPRVAVKLTDFGIAKLLDAQGVTSTGQVLGSPAHMAPEQIEGGDVDARADVFGLGVLLYECMVGHLPFEGNNPAQVLRRVLEGQYPAALAARPLVGARWSEILDRALAHVPADRFASAGAMSDAIAEELERLGFTAPLRELASWLDDPVAYEPAYKARIVERLCASGDEARRRRDALGAASDYNRALAYAPDDPHLMRIVAGLYRAEARARDMRRGAYVLATIATVGVAGWALQHHFRSGVDRRAVVAVAPPAMTAPAPDPLRAVAPALENGALNGAPTRELPTAGPMSPPRTRAEAPRAIAPVVGVSGPRPAPSVDRTITLDLKPPMGVDVSLDGQPARAVSTGNVLTVDAGTHSLLFSCSVCAPAEVALAPGDRNERLVVTVPVKPATLVVEGNVAKTYQIAQHPELNVRAGTNTISLKSAFEHVTIKEIESGSTISVRLEAGKSVRASFE
jgi:serine/threonine protein kinase